MGELLRRALYPALGCVDGQAPNVGILNETGKDEQARFCEGRANVQSRSCGQSMSGSRDPPVFWRDGDLPQTHAVARFGTEENLVVHPLGRRGNQTRKGQADVLRCKDFERPGLDGVSSSQRPYPPV